MDHKQGLESGGKIGDLSSQVSDNTSLWVLEWTQVVAQVVKFIIVVGLSEHGAYLFEEGFDG